MRGKIYLIAYVENIVVLWLLTEFVHTLHTLALRLLCVCLFYTIVVCYSVGHLFLIRCVGRHRLQKKVQIIVIFFFFTFIKSIQNNYCLLLFSANRVWFSFKSVLCILFPPPIFSGIWVCSIEAQDQHSYFNSYLPICWFYNFSLWSNQKS